MKTTNALNNTAGNENFSANMFLEAYATTVTAASTTTLTIASAQQQFFTGTNSQVVKMPLASTVALGQKWLIVNNSTSSITIESSGSNTIIVLAANTQSVVTCILSSGTSASSWFATIPATGGGGSGVGLGINVLVAQGQYV